MDRAGLIRQHFYEMGVDAIFTMNSANRQYLTGFTGSSGYVLVASQETVLLTDSRYMEQARRQTSGVNVMLHARNFLETLRSQCRRLGVTRLGFEPEAVTYRTFENLTQSLPEVSLVPVPPVVETARQIKDAGELSAIQEAARIADAAFEHILNVIRPGLSERDVALELEIFMRKMGASGVSFDTIVASGERSALPHGVASDRIIQAGEFVKMDYGCLYRGYASDITRTVAVGQPSARHREIYEIVLDAQLTALSGIRAGLTGHEADQLARNRIVAAGYGDNFGHSLGHGLGLVVHEMPRLAQHSTDVLQEGMVVTVEPGIYVPGFGGVRIEDDIVVRANTCERLTHAAKDLIVL